MPLPQSFRAPISAIVDDLVRGNFEALDADGRSGRVGAVGGLPETAYELAEAGPVTSRPGEWWIVLPMWTAEEGRSDLSLELSATPTAEGHKFEVTDLHTL